MAKKKTSDTNGPWGNMRPGRHTHDQFEVLASPLGFDGAETPMYSPDECVEEALEEGESNQHRRGPHGSEYARNERRGG